MAHRGHDVAPASKGVGNGAMDTPVTLGRLAKPLAHAVFPHQRMQAYRARFATDRVQQPVKLGYRLQAAHRSGRQCAVDQFRVHPIEQADVENEIPILCRQTSP